MYRNLLLTIALVLPLCGVLIEARNRNESRCYHFSWLGPQFNNESIFMNATCRDVTRLANGIPCRQPLVASDFDDSDRDRRLNVFSEARGLTPPTSKFRAWNNGFKKNTEDGTWPSVDYIWEHYADEATCVLADTDVCAQYTVFFDGRVLNSTYMCTRAVDSNNTAITNGCYEEIHGSSLTRVCFCRSMPGVRPCNSATPLSIIFATFIMSTVFLFISNNYLMWFSILSK